MHGMARLYDARIQRKCKWHIKAGLYRRAPCKVLQNSIGLETAIRIQRTRPDGIGVEAKSVDGGETKNDLD
jgi:hypothetical protein